MSPEVSKMKYKISDINSSSISTSTTKNNIDRNNTIFKQIWQIGNKHLVIIDESIILKLGIIVYNNNIQRKKPFKNKTKNGYEMFNIVSKTGDSIYTVDIGQLKEELAKGGTIHVSLDEIQNIKDLEYWKRVGSSLNIKDDD